MKLFLPVNRIICKKAYAEGRDIYRQWYGF